MKFPKKIAYVFRMKKHTVYKHPRPSQWKIQFRLALFLSKSPDGTYFAHIHPSIICKTFISNPSLSSILIELQWQQEIRFSAANYLPKIYPHLSEFLSQEDTILTITCAGVLRMPVTCTLTMFSQFVPT